jgi:hypothetical protein
MSLALEDKNHLSIDIEIKIFLDQDQKLVTKLDKGTNLLEV